MVGISNLSVPETHKLITLFTDNKRKRNRAAPMSCSLPCPQPAFFLWKKCRNKGKQTNETK